MANNRVWSASQYANADKYSTCIQIHRVTTELSKQTGSLLFRHTQCVGSAQRVVSVSVRAQRVWWVGEGTANKRRLSSLSKDELSHWELVVTRLIHRTLWHLLHPRSALICGAERFHHRAGGDVCRDIKGQRERKRKCLPAGNEHD